MMRLVIRDYFTAFRWKKIKENNKVASLWYIVYFSFFLPLMVLGSLRTGEGILIFNLVTFPIVFGLFAETIHPLRLPKMMYLCPMTKKMRKEYITKTCFMRIMVPIVLGIMAVAGLLVSGKCDLLCGAGILLNDIIFSVFVGAGVNINGYGMLQNIGRTTGNMNAKNILLEVIISVITILAGFIYSSELTSDTGFSTWEKWILLGTLLVFSFPAIVVYLRGWQASVEYAINYESSYVVCKK